MYSFCRVQCWLTYSVYWKKCLFANERTQGAHRLKTVYNRDNDIIYYYVYYIYIYIYKVCYI